MKKIILLSLICIGLVSTFLLLCSSQPADNTLKFKTASEFYDNPKTKVLSLGTIHFNYPNLDEMKTSKEDQVDILSESRQKELQEMIAYLKKFKPNKIAIEAYGDKFTNDLKAYKKGNLKLSRDERHQFGVRLAHELDLDTLYAIDAGSILNDVSQTNPKMIEDMLVDYDFKSDDLVDSIKRKWFEYEKELIKTCSLLEYHQYINSRESHQYGYGDYLTGDFRLGEFRGADALSMYWYNRNLRTFRKLQDITESPDDRILLIFGNGHAALFRQFLEFSPEYEFVELNSL